MITVGITGIIGSGKTTVAGLLRDRGIPVVDLDGLAKKAFTRKDVREDIHNHFGEGYVAGQEVLVEKVRDTVFSDTAMLSILESIVHPRILEDLWKLVKTYFEEGAKVVIVDGPLLYEKGLHKSLDRIIVVSASSDNICKRLQLRGLSKEDIERRTSLQIPLKDKETMADAVILNDGTKRDLEDKLEDLMTRINEWEVRADAP